MKIVHRSFLISICILISVSFAFADTGWFDDFITVSVDGVETTYSVDDFNNTDLGDVTTLKITSAEMKYWSDTQDRTGGAFYWSNDGSNYNEVIWTQEKLAEANNYKGTWSGEIDVTGASGSKQLYIYAKSWSGDGGQGDSFLNNGGNNYSADYNALLRARRYDNWQSFETTSFTLDHDGDTTLTFAVEWGEGDWDASGSQLGYGTNDNGSGWTWVDIDYKEDGDGSSKRCSTTVTFDAEGTYYYTYKFTKNTNAYHVYGSPDWEAMETAFNPVSTITIQMDDPATPITLTSFDAVCTAGAVELSWETASETNNAQFIVYRDDASIATLTGAGTTSEPQTYSYTDTNVIPGNTYTYILADLNYANEETRFEDDAVTVTVSGSDVAQAENYQIGETFPNPFNPSAILPLTLSESADVSISLYSLTGREIRNLHHGVLSSGSHSIRVDGSGLSAGIYMLRTAVNNHLSVQKIALVK